MLFNDRPITSIAELLSALKEVTPSDGLRWYRGHANEAWKLIPSLARQAGGVAAEGPLLKRFKQNALTFLLRPPQTEWEWLFLMQHHGTPTRLLDWTENPLVALYFAVEPGNAAGTATDACVWSLDPISLNARAHFKTPIAADLPCLEVDEELDAYLPKSVASAPYERTPVAALAMRQFSRVTAQSGVFTVTHREQTAIEAADEGIHVGRLVIPAAAKPGLASELRLLGVHRLSLFPDLDSVSALAREVTG